MANLLARQLGRLFGYDATDKTGKRSAPATNNKSEDDTLLFHKRTQLAGGVADLQRNFSVAAWMIRKHLDYVSTFEFQCRSGNTDVDDQVEGLVRWWGKPWNFDAAGRHGLKRAIRLAESCRVVAGDVFLNLLNDGKVQAIEFDRVQNPPTPIEGVDQARFVQGVLLNADGKATAYAVCKRNEYGRIEFDRLLSAQYVVPHGFYQRFDQVRGVSPLAPALNSLRDVYEGFDYALAKAKVSQLFALAFYRDNSEAIGETAAETDEGESGYNVNFGKGPVQLDLDPGDRAEFLESKTPSTEFQSFTQAMIGVSLKALDIPYSFYDEAHTNYSGARQALLMYEQSAETKRNEVRAVLDRLTLWRIQMFIRDGDLVLPKGMTIGDVQWEWIHAGLPWIDPLKEINADIAAIGAGLESPQNVCKRSGRDFYEIIDQIADARTYADGKGVDLSFVPQPVVPDPAQEEPANGKPAN